MLDFVLLRADMIPYFEKNAFQILDDPERVKHE